MKKTAVNHNAVNKGLRRRIFFGQGFHRIPSLIALTRAVVLIKCGQPFLVRSGTLLVFRKSPVGFLWCREISVALFKVLTDLENMRMNLQDSKMTQMKSFQPFLKKSPSFCM
ncbi:hypothetical protein TNCV_4753991 [Trichonephila clavipes]|nr:hypothetical protein TNCV_4753991 [Trichonephila clavipes]